MTLKSHVFVKLKFHQIFCLLPQAPIILSSESKGSDQVPKTCTQIAISSILILTIWNGNECKNFTKPPHLASLTVVGRSLHAVGGCFDDEGDIQSH